MARIGVAGGGAWGTALAQVAARAGHHVLWWLRDPAQAVGIQASRRNARRLPEIELLPEIEATSCLDHLAAAECILLAVPAQAVRDVCQMMPQGRIPLVICAKGIERGTGLRLSQIAGTRLDPAVLAVLSGPAYAREVASDLPAAVTIAAADLGLARRLCDHLGTSTFRPYPSEDVIGVEIAGAMKNVIAIAAGIATGLALGENARAALVTRGLAEIGRLVEASGGDRATVMGLAGIGDLMLTATSLTSRNTRFGYDFARGNAPSGPGAALAEGVWTADAALAAAGELGVDLPITRAVAGVLAGALPVEEAISGLLARPRPERE